MPRFGWSRKRPGSLGSSVPGRKFRIAACALIVPASWLLAGPVGLAWSSWAVLLIAPEIVELWCWFVAKAEAHAVRRDERIYRYGYTDIRMLMVGGNPWFAAADVGSALGLTDVDEETRHFDVAHCNFVGGELYLSEAGVAILMGLSRHPDARSFRIWFEREVMFPLNRAREGRAGDALSRRSGA
jgi:hypothetical protein